MGLGELEVVPSPKFQKNWVRLPEAMAVEVAGEKDVPFISHKGLAEKLTIGGGKIPNVCVSVALQP